MKISIFRDIIGNSNYQITNDGKVWSKIKQKFLKTYIDKRGYEYVDLGYKNTKSVHRLVFETFYK